MVILDPKDYGPWLTCTPDEAHGYLKQWHVPLQGEAAPLPKRAKASALGSGPRIDPSTSGYLI